MAVEKVIFRKGRPLASDNHVPFTIRWDIALKDGRTFMVEVEAEAKPAMNMVSYGIRLLPSR